MKKPVKEYFPPVVPLSYVREKEKIEFSENRIMRGLEKITRRKNLK
jgi:hypothetical protein